MVPVLMGAVKGGTVFSDTYTVSLKKLHNTGQSGMLRSPSRLDATRLRLSRFNNKA